MRLITKYRRANRLGEWQYEVREAETRNFFDWSRFLIQELLRKALRYQLLVVSLSRQISCFENRRDANNSSSLVGV